MSQIDTIEDVPPEVAAAPRVIACAGHAASGKVAVIVPTRGRPRIVRDLIRQLAEQSRPPDHIFVIASAPADVAELEHCRSDLTVHVGRPGSSAQRNDGLRLAGSGFAAIVFFDDDFFPSRFWLERMVRLLEAHPSIDGVTGTVLADGASTAGIDPDEALALVGAHDRHPLQSPALQDNVSFGGNTGCNMAFRYSAIRDIAFDERLPAYAWLEDADFRGQVVRNGRFVRAEALWGVHLGHKQGRARGVALGYSQIANAVYLARKGTVPAAHLAPLAIRNVLSNLVRSVRPEPFVDRRGRLAGNLIAIGDILRGRLAPERVLTL